MTDLTEQWLKGELPDGWYYVKVITEFEYPDDIAFYTGEYFELYSDEDIEQVLTPLPSYEEYQQLKEYERIVASYYMKPIDYETACETVNKLLDEKKAFKEENAKLKTDCKTLAQKLLQVKPELREWLEVNYKEYL